VICFGIKKCDDIDINTIEYQRSKTRPSYPMENEELAYNEELDELEEQRWP